jgi:hypothetical protein
MSGWRSANHDAITMQQRTKVPEECLWTAVLTRAVQDVFTTSDWQATRGAIAWFKSKSKDFREVCELAGRNPDYVYSKMISKINSRETYIDTFKERRPYAKGMSPLILRNRGGRRGRTKGTKIPKWHLSRKVNLDGKEYSSNNLSNV